MLLATIPKHVKDQEINLKTNKIMKKSKIKLHLNKQNVSTLKIDEIKGGVSGRTCDFTNKYYKTCYSPCTPQPTWNDCENTQVICDH